MIPNGLPRGCGCVSVHLDDPRSDRVRRSRPWRLPSCPAYRVTVHRGVRPCGGTGNRLFTRFSLDSTRGDIFGAADVNGALDALSVGAALRPGKGAFTLEGGKTLSAR
jgi:hypothetical protein